MIDAELLARVRRIQVRTRRAVTDVMAGGYSSVFRGSGIEFEEVREFAEGDDIRSVDWNVTARMGRPYVKKFVEERQLTVQLAVDLSASTSFGTVPRTGGGAPGGGLSERRRVRDSIAEFCAAIALSAARNNDQAGLLGFSDRIERFVPARKGQSHVLRIIRDVLAWEPHGTGSDLVGAVEHLLRVQRKRAVVFLVSDFLVPLDAALQRALARASSKHDVIAVRISDPRTRELAPAGLIRVRDPELRRDVLVDSSSRRVREAYRANIQRLDEELDRMLKRARVERIDLRTDQSPVEPILQFFRRREQKGARG